MWGAIGALAGLVGGAIYNHWSAQEAMEDQAWYNRDAQIWSARELPTLQLEGMRKAGVNPMLAYGNLGSVAAPNVNAVAADAPDFSSVGSEIGKAVSRNSALKLQAQDLENKKAEKTLTDNQAEYYKALADKEKLNLPVITEKDPVNSAKRIMDQVRNSINSAKKEGVQEVADETKRSRMGQPITKEDIAKAREAQRKELRRREEEKKKDENKRRLKERMKNDLRNNRGFPTWLGSPAW